jgi:hypothetical protein
MLRSTRLRLGCGRFFSSNGLVSLGSRLMNWVVNGLATFCSASKARIWLKEMWAAIPRPEQIQKTCFVFLKSPLNVNEEDAHSKRDIVAILNPFGKGPAFPMVAAASTVNSFNLDQAESFPQHPRGERGSAGFILHLRAKYAL